MSPINNPFVRGYQRPRIVRTLLITYEEDCPPVWRPLHPSQAHLPDDQVGLFPCLIGDDFALITEGQDVPQDLEATCTAEGIVRSVVYAIAADDFDGQPVHVGDTYSEEAAREAVGRLTFTTGFYSRCWEISSGHIPEKARQYLEDLADASTLSGLFFEAFRMPDSDTVGVKLIATPWTDANLKVIVGWDAQALHKAQTDACVPEPLITVMQLAALADVRILIFDPNAAILDGLPVYEE